MIQDARTTIENGAQLTPDICIIGGGAAGLSIAHTLRGSGKKVLVLEGGGRKPTSESQAIYKGKSTGHKYFDLAGCRSRYLGGSTNCWAGLCMPLDPIDFEERAWIPHSGWPIQYADLEDFYTDAEKLLNIGNFKLSSEVPFPIKGPLERTYFQKSLSNIGPPPTRMGTTLGPALEQAKDISILLHANVTHIQLNDSGNQVNAISVSSIDQSKKFSVVAKQFILATGGIENPRLLLNSRDIHTNGIGNSNDIVGRYFMEHPHIDFESVAAFHQPVDVKLYRSYIRPKRKDRIWEHLKPSETLLKKEKLNNFGIVLLPQNINPKRKNVIPLVQEIHVASTAFDHATSTYSPLPINTQKKVSLFSFGTPIEQAPNPNSRVTLSTQNERDSLGMLRVNLHWEIDDSVKRTLRRAHELTAETLTRAGLARVRVTPNLKKDLPPQTKGGFHHMGTTRMHDNPKKGVVDANGKVHGVDNLYIAGSSVFPTSGAANPTLTIVALALRLAKHLREIK